MRSPVDSIRMDCGVNRLSVSHDDRALVAVPLDNRHIKIYDLSGNRVSHVPRRNHLVGEQPKIGVFYVYLSCKNLHAYGTWKNNPPEYIV